MRSTFLAILASSAVLFALPASATLIGGEVLDRAVSNDAFEQGGTFEKLTLPFNPPNGATNTVGDDTFQRPNFYGFDEEQNVSFSSDLNVDLLAGSGGSGVLRPEDVTGSIVASHYLFFDPGPSTNLLATAKFDADILAIMWSRNTLDDSDFLANTGVTYLNPTLRGFESPDSVELLSDRELEFRASASTPGDYFRVLTEFSPRAEVPLPGTLLLLVPGIAGLLLARSAGARRAG
jgi:hypothetical protein